MCLISISATSFLGRNGHSFVFRVADYGSFNKLADLLEAISMTVELVAFPKGVKIVKLLAFDEKSDAAAASEPVSLFNEKNCFTTSFTQKPTLSLSGTVSPFTTGRGRRNLVLRLSTDVFCDHDCVF